MADATRIKVRFAFRLFRILIVSATLFACSGLPQDAPVQDRRPPPSNKLNHHIVSRGETLYSIAWRYGLDYKALARYNGIPAGYTIYPGQRLELDLSQSPAPATKTTPPHKPSPPKKKRSKSQTTLKVPAPAPSPPDGSFHWQWPAKGRLLQGFSSSNGLNKGIDIVGELGEPVTSAASGLVVYAGSGLRGYGNLLIIKHSQKYLSAYAHNRKLLVSEGEKVKAGQKIAEIGSSGTNRNKLHFEIRRDGKPVDPLKYLPKR